MSTPLNPEIFATISLLHSSDGGRSSSIPYGEYRGVLGVGHESFSCRFFVSEPQGLAPSETGTYGIQFLVPKVALPHFFKGTAFTLWEGKVVGNGIVSEVIST
jgi:hypothetical protein